MIENKTIFISDIKMRLRDCCHGNTLAHRGDSYTSYGLDTYISLPNPRGSNGQGNELIIRNGNLHVILVCSYFL